MPGLPWRSRSLRVGWAGGAVQPCPCSAYWALQGGIACPGPSALEEQCPSMATERPEPPLRRLEKEGINW